MNEIALQQQRTIDRVALAGSLLAAFAAAAFLAFDPVQTVARRPAQVPAAVVPVAAAPAPALADTTPVRSVALPAPTWSAVSDGQWAAYVSSDDKGSPGEIVVRRLANEDWHVAYVATPGRYLGQLSLAAGLLAFEELVPAGTSGAAPTVTVKTLRIDSAELSTIDEYLALDLRYGEGGGYASSSPVTDGSRVFWIHQTAMSKGGVCNEIRMRDNATGATTIVYQKMTTLGSLAVWGDTLAFTRFTEPASSAFLLDIPSRKLAAVDGFDFSVVQSAGPAGVVVTGGSFSGSAASWLVRADGTTSRLASDCYNVLANERLSAMRCATQIEIRDLATGDSLFAFAGTAGALAIFPTGVLWAEGDSLSIYEVQPLGGVFSETRPN